MGKTWTYSGKIRIDRAKIMDSYLFASPSFLSGVARVVDLGGIFDDYNVSRTPQEADAAGLRSDWADVGRDLRSAFQAESDRQSRTVRER
jgi:hypothetical protein